MYITHISKLHKNLIQVSMVNNYYYKENWVALLDKDRTHLIYKGWLCNL